MKRATVTIIVLACCAIAQAQTPPTELSDRVDALANKMLSRPVAGISIAIARDGQVVFARGYGRANLEHSVPVTPETLFHIDSISKNILSAVVLQLVDEGKLRLNDDVAKLIDNRFGHRYFRPEDRPPGALPVEIHFTDYPVALPSQLPPASDSPDQASQKGE